MKRLLFDEDGSVLTEYGILVVIVAIGLIGVLGFFRDAIVTKFEQIIKDITGAA